MPTDFRSLFALGFRNLCSRWLGSLLMLCGLPAYADPAPPNAARPGGVETPELTPALPMMAALPEGVPALIEPLGESAMPSTDAPAGQAAERAPPPVSRFQRFVEAQTGELLPAYGAEYFALPQDSFSPPRGTAIPADYAIGPGDEILVRVTGVMELTLPLKVDPSGRVVLPKVGAVPLVGVTAGQLEGYLTRQLGRSFKNFTLTATLTEARSIEFYVAGHAARPGKHAASALSSLLNAVFLVGGPSPTGSLRRVQLLRRGALAAEFDLYDFMRTGSRTQDVPLLSGDTIFFPPAGAQVAVLGEVDQPGIFELLQATTTVGDVLALQGALPATTSSRRALLERIAPDRTEALSVVELSLDEAGLSLPLRNGDLLHLLPVNVAFENGVTLRGNVAVPGRYPFRAGMRVRDLLPDRASLVPRRFHQRRNALSREKAGDDSMEVASAAEEVQSRSDEVNWEYAVVERFDPTALTTTLHPFHLGRAVLDQDEAQNLVLQPGDVVTIFSHDDAVVPEGLRPRRVRIEGEVAAPGVYQLVPGETLPALLQRIGGLTPEAYVFGTSLKRTSLQESQQRTLERVIRALEAQMRFELASRRANLRGSDAALQQAQIAAEERLVADRLNKLRELVPEGRLSLELNPRAPELPAVKLEDGDVVFVPPTPSFVGVVGAVHTESGILHRVGRNVANYLEVAGLAENADLDAVFVVRADGSVQTRARGVWGWFGNRVHRLRLEPGDVVVVPERLATESAYTVFVRELKDWAAIVADVGLAAAIATSALR